MIAVATMLHSTQTSQWVQQQASTKKKHSRSVRIVGSAKLADVEPKHFFTSIRSCSTGFALEPTRFSMLSESR